MESAADIGNYLIVLSRNGALVYTYNRLMCMLYLAQGWHLGIYGFRLFSEDMRVVLGDVCPFEKGWRVCAGSHTDKGEIKLDNVTLDDGNFNYVGYEGIETLDKALEQFLCDLHAKYKHYTDYDLKTEAFRTGSPWNVAVRTGRDVISDEEMREYFCTKFRAGEF